MPKKKKKINLLQEEKMYIYAYMYYHIYVSTYFFVYVWWSSIQYSVNKKKKLQKCPYWKKYGCKWRKKKVFFLSWRKKKNFGRKFAIRINVFCHIPLKILPQKFSWRKTAKTMLKIWYFTLKIDANNPNHRKKKWNIYISIHKHIFTTFIPVTKKMN